MGKISNYARVLVAKLQDVLVIDTTDSNVTTTKSVTVEQIGDTIAGTQVHSALTTSDKTLIGAIKEVAKDKNMADEYDDTHTYNTGDVTIYGNTLYICQDDNVTGDFDPSKWTATTVQSLIGSLSSLTTTNKDSLVEAVNEVNANKADSSDVYTKTQIDSISSATIAPTAGNGNVYYKTIGNLVIVFGLINTTSGMSTGQDVITGLPRNMNGANNVIKAINNDGTSADWVLYQTNGGTSMKTSIVHTGAKSYTISFAYYTS